MSVARRKTKNGYTKEYHYAFAQDGKRYRGVCEGCTTKREAEEYEKNLRRCVQEAAAQKDVKQLYEHFREELTGSKDILLADAYEKSLENAGFLSGGCDAAPNRGYDEVVCGSL